MNDRADLPKGWERTTVGEVGRYLNGRGFKKSEWNDTGRPIIRIQNLTGSSQVFNYYEGEADERHTVRNGDLLVSWAATLGVYVWRGPEAVVNQHIFKVESYINPQFHRFMLDHALSDLRRQAHGSGMVHITKGNFDATRLLLPPRAEQERIVGAIEEHLSRLDAAAASLALAEQRLGTLHARLVDDAFRTAHNSVPVGELADVRGGIQKQPKRRPRDNPAPFLRVANVGRGIVTLDEVHEIELFEGEIDRYRLLDGDLLVVEGNGSPDQIGRSAVWRGQIEDCVHQNHLIRVRPGPKLDADFLGHYWNAPSTRSRLTAVASSTSGLHTLSTSKVKQVEVPVLPLAQQAEIAKRLAAQSEAFSRLRASLRDAQARQARLRRSILSAAFSGQLVPQDPDDEPASVLLERITAERAAAPPPKRRRKAASA
ncbi:MAG: restriction endonuclease subunit S [Iamia sp.]